MKKIDIYKEILATYQKIDNEFGEYMSYTRISLRNASYVATHSKQELEDLLFNVQGIYTKKQNECKQAEYFATDEGKANLEKLENEIANVNEQCKQIIVDGNNHFSKIFKEFLGERWEVRYYDTNMDVYLLDDKGKPLFGHDFTFYITRMFSGDKKFEINYGCLGSFEVFKDNDRIEYLRGMAKVANDADMCQLIYNDMMGYSIKLEDLYNKRRDLESQKKDLGLS